jgi:hypothetical protein
VDGWNERRRAMKKKSKKLSPEFNSEYAHIVYQRDQEGFDEFVKDMVKKTDKKFKKLLQQEIFLYSKYEVFLTVASETLKKIDKIKGEKL